MIVIGIVLALVLIGAYIFLGVKVSESIVNSDVTMEKIMDIMKTPPSWCSDLPLDAEGGVSQVYDK